MMIWFWLVQAIAGSIIGSATSKWFEDTRLGKWFFEKTEDVYNWAAERYDFKILQTEDKWKDKYPNIAYQMHLMEERIVQLERKIK